MVKKRLNKIEEAAQKKRSYGIKLFSDKRVNILNIAVLAIFFSAVIGLFIYPATAKTISLQSKLSSLELEVKQKAGIVDRMQDLVARYRKDLRLADELVFTDRDIATFLENFSEFSRTANVTLLSIKSQKVKPVPAQDPLESELEKKSRRRNTKKSDDEENNKPGLLMQPMDIKIKGTYNSIIDFLISLEEYRQLLTINNLNITVSREGYPQLEASFLMRMYKMDSAEDAGNGRSRDEA